MTSGNFPGNDNNNNMVVYTFPGGPVSLFSVISIKSGKRKSKRNTVKTPIQPLINPYLEKWGLATAIDAVKRKKVFLYLFQAESFSMCLEPVGSLTNDPDISYDPMYLDNPALNFERDNTIITLPSFLGSIIQPSTASEMKKTINQRFKETHPGVDYSLSLSQIRNLKALMCKVGVATNLRALTIASAIVYIEKLILKHFVNKSNKRLIAGNFH
jgi:hypothetical protein